MIKEERLHAISIMRVMAMLMIVTYHSMLYYTETWWMFDKPIIPLWEKLSNILNAIDLPMFVFISGVLFGHLYITKHKYRDKKKFIIKKFQRLIIPYIFWGIFLIIFMPSINKVENLFIGIGHLWFLLMLYEVFVIVILGAKFLCINASRWHLFLLYICLCIIFCLYHIFSNHQFFLCIHATLLYLPAFILGICCARFHFEHIITGKWARILLLMSLACLSIYMLYDIKTPFIADYLIQMLTGYTIILCTFVLLSKKTHSTKKLPNIITNADHLSLGIYIFNQIVINALLLMPGIPYVLNNHYYIGVPMLFLIGLIIPYTLTWLLCKNRYLKWTIGG